MVEENAYFERLAEIGYEIKVYQSVFARSRPRTVRNGVVTTDPDGPDTHLN